MAERPVTVFFDMDGTTNGFLLPFVRPYPFLTAARLIAGFAELPPRGIPLVDREEGNFLRKALMTAFYSIRPFTPDSKAGLELLRQMQQDFQEQRDIKAGILSGRVLETHPAIMRHLRRSGRIEYFDPESIYLNTSTSTHGWKEHYVEEEVKKGRKVVLFEDNVDASRRAARMDEDYADETRVLVFMIEHFLNKPWFLTSADIQLPANIIPTKNIVSGMVDLRSRMRSGLF